MDDLLLSDSEIEALRESLQGTEHQEILDQKARKVIAYFKDLLAERGISAVTPMVREGHPAEEILKTATEEDVDLIVMGSRGRRMHNLFLGSVSREVTNNTDRSILLVK